ncbi:Mal regulon transcriptional regulator MalI [Parasalinivibrio latis]|uniref:Mal regulon transcriptional regulator MalI n=1 Tax=Parasalinivibrio latis TaxID=2952610 RepID=UPI0006D01F9B
MSFQRVKITDVAEHAGVSVTTVSMVLRNKGRISPATQEKVQRSIELLGYVPNNSAANLRASSSNMVGLILRDITCPFYNEMTAGLSEVLEQHDMMLFLAQCGDDGDRLIKCMQHMMQQGVAGIIFNPVRRLSDEQARLIRDIPVPLVCAARAHYRDEFDSIGPDNAQAARDATQHLIGKGHRHIAYVGGAGDSLSRAERIGGYCTSLMQYGLPFKNDWVVECGRSRKEAAEAVKQLLHAHPKVTAILCHYPETAFGALYGIAQAGRTAGKDMYIGQQVAVVGFDDVPEAELTSPALTFVSSTGREIGRESARRLMARLKDEKLTAERLITKPVLVERHSA